VHRVRSEVGLPTTRARPHGDALNDQQASAFAKAASDVLQVQLVTAAVSARTLS
jgi:hypothetical protein